MKPNTEKVVSEALRLPPDARAFVAEKILESLDVGDDFTISPAWRQEIQRRCRELDAGTVAIVPGDDVLKEPADRSE